MGIQQDGGAGNQAEASVHVVDACHAADSHPHQIEQQCRAFVTLAAYGVFMKEPDRGISAVLDQDLGHIPLETGQDTERSVK